jgi:hypothetical protein
LFEQKGQEQQNKLLWAERNAISGDSLVVGSLMVAASPGTVLSKKQLFTPPQSPAAVHAPVNINKCSYAPLSSFQPEKKREAETASHSVGGNVKQVTTSLKPRKQRTGLTQQTKTGISVSNEPRLSMTRDGIQQEHSMLNSTVVKFEKISRETSTPVCSTFIASKLEPHAQWWLSVLEVAS